ncbi:tRNA pseudouridine(13) synthase TruD [Aliarcobacter cryaerophilus]|uniref:tRNA pseudouridine synthase D n=2 Tax=unclassified Arcobacter TaxID=2593671 RepID=A0AA96I0A6_9BACT|nr:tRNA pseudouridine(13) synthase TruD [Arcobacter sp. AZ-2023]WPD09536.1 tRNA pseudouridine(13) synthase TruD [Arcobacter sp. DSM 115954]WNL14366.1 tRNA pseudouridine(13) synthase TruD [Arcobacter sp. AZ-2023]WNL19751.1 tRNA pseudouridine(13) synthase TruD [Arcobacter sp. AZ-2023]WNL21892.1 tRNA pseudouridine(13) synthase TruD [Arcobacter sp. AZ-2023]
MKPQRFLNHSQIDVYFKQSKDDFVVNEVPLYEFSNEGEHLILKLRKKDLATWDAIEILGNYLKCSTREFGYAGLKDKNAMTVQHISIHRKYEDALKSFNHENIKILETTYHNNKIKIGHLKGNNFFIRLKRVGLVEKQKIEEAFSKIAVFGMPNYFGFQRFGIDGENYKKGKQIVEGTLKERNRNLKQMFINAYQSYLFNAWLSKRIEISKLIEAFEPKEIFEKLNLPLDEVKRAKKQPHPFKILTGDLLSHYPFGKIFIIDDLETESQKFFEKDRVPTGLLCGKRVKKSEGLAYGIEKDFEVQMSEDGARRFAFVFPENLQSNYKEDKNHMELSFYLPKGSYATELIAEILH